MAVESRSILEFRAFGEEAEAQTWGAWFWMGRSGSALTDFTLLNVPIQFLNLKAKTSWETKPEKFFLVAAASAPLINSFRIARALEDTL